MLRRGALDEIERWQATSTARQRAALSELFWSLQDHLTAARGRSETKQAYGPKAYVDARKSVAIVDPFHSTLFQPSTQPIVPMVHQKMEQKQRDAEVAMLAGAAEAKALKEARRAARNPWTEGSAKDGIDTLRSKIPMKWPIGDATLETCNQAQMRTVTPADLRTAIGWSASGKASVPDASCGMGRHLGGAKWHGDAMHARLTPLAAKTFQPLAEMRRPHDIAGLKAARGHRYVT